MKDTVQVSSVQFAAAWFEREKNAERMQQFAREAARAGSELIVFPEYSNIGQCPPLEDTWSFDKKNDAVLSYVKAAEPIPGPTTDALAEVARSHGVYIVVGIVQAHPVMAGLLYNSAALIGPSGVVGVHHKMHIAGMERFFFIAGESSDVYQTRIGNIGMQICYDTRFPELGRIQALKGAEIICAISANGAGERPYLEMDKYRADCRAQENGVYFISCCLSGQQGDTRYVGHSSIARPGGGIMASSESDAEEVLTVQCSNDEILRVRSTFAGVFRDRRPELYSLITAPLAPTSFVYPIKEEDAQAPKRENKA